MKQSSSRARTIQPLLALFAGAGLTLTTLLMARPRLAGAPASWSTDDLALECLWCAAAICSAWFAATTVACIAALAGGNPRVAHRVAHWAPPLARRVLQAALISTWALVPAAAAYATPAAGPVVVYVGADGRLTTASGRDAPSDAPVVRAPAPAPATATSTTLAPTTTTTTARAPTTGRVPPRTAAPAAGSAPARSVPARSTPARRRSHVHIVQPGDNLWRIAEIELAQTTNTAPNDSQIAVYWQRLIAANRATLRSGNPSLIFPGEAVALPPHTL